MHVRRFTGDAPPISTEFLHAAGFSTLTPDPPAEDVAHRLRQLARLIGRVDPLMRETVRVAALTHLRELGVRSAARLVDAALTVRANGDKSRPAVVREDRAWPEPVDGALLLDRMASLLTRHIALPTRSAADAVVFPRSPKEGERENEKVELQESTIEPASDSRSLVFTQELVPDDEYLDRF